MPLMMEDIDDLFGDGTGLSLPSRPPSKELYQRIDEMRGSGCCQGIAWSKWGSIASITSNGAALELRNLRCSPEDGSWALSEPSITPPLVNMDGGPLKHLCWSPTGSELAVIDSAGRVTILAIFASLNKPSISRNCQVDPPDDLHKVVGCYWLNLGPYPANRLTFLHGPGVKDGSNIRYEGSQAPVLGPYHPNHQKSALVCVTTNGILRVLWPQNTGKWYESHTEIESIVSSDDLITHAAICSDKAQTLLVAFATTSKQLRTVRVGIDWGVPKPIPEKANPATLSLTVTVRMRHLAVTSWLHDIPGETLNASSLEPSMVQLSHLEFLPPFGDPSGRTFPPTIVAVRSHLPVPISAYNQNVHTTVDRWEVRDRPQAIHPAFEQLSSRRNSVGSNPNSVHFMKKLESFTVNRILVSIHSMNLGQVIVFSYSDNTVEYRDRGTMMENFVDDNLDRIWHLAQIGFTYPDDEPCLQATLSPSSCSFVQIRNDGKVVWKRLEYNMGSDIGSSMDDSRYFAIIAALTLSCSNAVLTNANYDDILATVRKDLTPTKPNLSYDWIHELSRILKVNVDYTEESHYDVLIRNTTIQLCLSIQQSLGFNGEFNPRTFRGKFSWIALQLRNIVVVVTMAANVKVKGPNNEPATPLEDPEVISALAGSVRWVLDLLAWIIDTLLTLPTTVPSSINLKDASTLSLPDLLAHLRATNNISLHLVLSSAARGFLTALCRRLAHIDYIARRAIMQTPPHPSLSPALRAAYTQIAQLTTHAILRLKIFETLITGLSATIKTAYGTQSKEARNAQEIPIVLGGALPEAFKGVIVELFKDRGLLDAVREEIEPARLFFADYALLEVEEGGVGRRKEGVTMDCFRKGWLANPGKGEGVGRQGARWRRCARCTAVMEDVLNPRQALQWLVMQQRRCFCSGYWDTLNAGETMA